MKRPTDRGLIKSLRRFSSQAIQRFSIIVAVSGIFCGQAGAQISPPDKNSARSISGQFIVSRPDQPSLLNVPPRIAAGTNLVRLEPALLAVSAERIKELLWHKLEIKGQWRGQIYLVLHRAQSPDEGVTILSQPSTGGWNYRVELPDVLSQTRFARALTGVLLLEFANRNAQSRSTEIPAWLADGLSQQLLATGSPEFLLSSPDKIVNGLPVTRLEKTRHGMDSLAGARQVLKNHPALTFEELSWPSGAQLDGDDDGVYRASAQLFVSEVLKLKNGPARLRAMLESLPQFYNGQVAFQSAFREDFPSPLDLEKWWALQVVNFAARDPGPGWTLAVSRIKLDEILRVPVAVRTTSNSLPTRSEISLQAVIRNLEPARQTAILQTKLRDLDLAQLRVARPYAVLTAEYRRAIGSYLGQRPAGAPAPSWATRIYRSLRKPSAASTIKKLDELDARRRNIDTAAQPEKSVQPVINH
ncbi:MAG: hypothetical protein PHY43_15760 [Verrucomicrobiales bacterium]|nr:hypothetical protein [Verrucomicrobiales bacterium]